MWTDKVRPHIFREQWNLGVIAQSAEDIVLKGVTAPIRWLPPRGRWQMLADPCFLLLPDGGRLLMAEHLDYWVGRGEIWVAHVPASADLMQAVFKPWLQSTIHLSYPFCFRDTTGALLLTVESWQSGALHLWRWSQGPLQYIGPVIEKPIIDATLWHDGTLWWLFGTLYNDRPNERLHLFHAPCPEGPWTTHPANPVKCDLGSSRPAGPLFRANGKLIRPAQDCTRTYGGAIVLHEVTRLDREGFAELPLRRLQPDAGSAYPHGMHTLCPAGDMTIIDGKRWAFHFLDIPRRLLTGLRNRTRGNA